jgi:signal transduction histidine kinase
MAEPVTFPDPEVAHQVSEFLPDGLITAVAPRGLIERINGRACQILGLQPSDLVGRRLEEALPFVDASGEPWWPQASPWQGLSIRTGFREKVVLLPNGRDLLITARYLRPVARGPVVAVLVGVRSADGRRRAEAEQAALISTIAHELRSPLTGVKGFSATLLRRWDRFTDEQKRLMIETIEADADRVTRLITELLDVSRIDARRLTLHARPIDVAQLFGRHVERIVASGHQGTFTTHVGVDTVWGDPDRIEQLLANVVDNALRHASSRVHLSSQPGPGGAVDLVVDDDGPGVPPERRELVFGKFWHGRAPGSTGLGLYIVRGLAEAHGGTVVIQEAPLGGARVRVRLPSHEDH